MSFTWSAGSRSGVGQLAIVLVDLLAEFGDHERQVVPDELRAAQDQQPPMSVDGTTSTMTAVRGPNASVSNAASSAPPVAPMKKM